MAILTNNVAHLKRQGWSSWITLCARPATWTAPGQLSPCEVRTSGSNASEADARASGL